MWRFLVLALPLVASRPLGTYNVDKSKISVSGLSSGGGMATIMHIAHSASIMGIGSFAGMPYGCYRVIPEPCNATQIVDFVRTAYSNGQVDNPDNIRNHNVYVFRGTGDRAVPLEVAELIRDYYAGFGAKSIATNFTSTCGHGMPSVNHGVECNATAMPGINRCLWSGAYHVTQQIYGDLQEPNDGMALPGQFYDFEQTEFFTGIEGHSMDPTGYVYVPSACVDSSTQCRLHVVFHGCFQARENLGAEYANSTGYNQVGERNNIIMLYPQAISDNSVNNPDGCWDGFSFTGLDHLYKSGKQVQIIKREIDRVTG